MKVAKKARLTPTSDARVAGRQRKRKYDAEMKKGGLRRTDLYASADDLDWMRRITKRNVGEAADGKDVPRAALIAELREQFDAQEREVQRLKNECDAPSAAGLPDWSDLRWRMLANELSELFNGAPAVDARLLNELRDAVDRQSSLLVPD